MAFLERAWSTRMLRISRRGEREEVRPVRELGLGAGEDLEIRLIDERRCLKRVPGPLAQEVPPRDAVQLRIDDRQKLFRGDCIAGADPRPQLVMWPSTAQNSSALRSG
jgi:hypothetical protein